MDWHPVRRECVVAVHLKLLYTTETSDKPLAYGPLQLLGGHTNRRGRWKHVEQYRWNDLCFGNKDYLLRNNFCQV